MAGPLKLGLALTIYIAAMAALLAFRLSPWILLGVGVVPLIILAALSIIEAGHTNRAAESTRRDLQAARSLAEQLQRRLAAAEVRLTALDEPVVITDEQGHIAAMNPAAESLLDLRADRLLGRPVEEAFTQADLLGLHERARQGEGVREQVRIAHAGGGRIWDVSASPLPNRAGVVLCLRDATEAALALKARADFVANASHELRTPIAAMRIALDTLDALGPEDGAMRARLNGVIAGNISRLEDMARDLLDLSRLEAEDAQPRPEPVALAALMRELAAAAEPACAARRLSLAFDIDPAVETVRSDRRLLSLVLSNLLDNAAKFAFEGTVIRIAARPVSGGAALRLDVIDRGIGIPLDQQQRIFERFYQVDAARTQGRRGTGLGLAIVKHAVRTLGGTIRVQSVWQQGTTMSVEVPIRPEGA